MPSVPTYRYPALQRRLDNINQQLAMIDQPQWELQIIEESVQPIADHTSANPLAHHWSVIELQGELPHLSGYTFYGIGDTTLQPQYGQLGNHDLPETVICEHCPKRPRRRTVLVATKGSYQQWGLECLHHHLKHPNTRILIALVRQLVLLQRQLHREKTRAQKVKQPQWINSEIAISFVLAHSNKHKYWVTRKSVGWQGYTSADRVLDYYQQPSAKVTPTEEEKQQAKDLLMWGRHHMVAHNKYTRSLQQLCQRDWIQTSDLGLLASLKTAAKIQEEEADIVDLFANSQHVGVVGEMMDATLRVVLRNPLTARFSRYSYVLQDMGGNQIQWITASMFMPPGTEIKARVKVKDHRERRLLPSTMLGYCRIIEIKYPGAEWKSLKKEKTQDDLYELFQGGHNYPEYQSHQYEYDDIPF